MIITLIENEMVNDGVKLVWDKHEESSDEEEKEVFDFRDKSVKWIFKILITASIIPFIELLFPLLSLDKSYQSLRKEITMRPDVFTEFIDWFLFFEIFDQRDLKYTKHQFTNILAISSEKFLTISNFRSSFIEFINSEKKAVLKEIPKQKNEKVEVHNEDYFKMLSTKQGPPSILSFLDEKSFELPSPNYLTS